MFAFEAVTGAKVIDCFELNDRLLFIVDQGYLAKALGREKSNIAKLSKMFNKKLKIVEFKPDPVLFVKNLISPLKPKSIELHDKTVQVIVKNPKIKGLILGSQKKNLKAYQDALNMHFKGLKIEVV